MQSNKLRTSARIGAVIWAAVIFGLSSIQGSDLPAGNYSTAGHFALYVVLGALLFWSLAPTTRARAIVAVALASAYGVSDEVHQLFVPRRFSDPVDWVVDTAGAITAVVVLSLMRHWRDSRAESTKAVD